jgi:hypothetical protein
VAARCAAFLEDPTNNIWSWATRHIEIEKKEFDETRLKKLTEQLLKKADNAGFKPKDIFAAMLASGLKVEDIVAFMDEVQAKA